MFLSLNYYVEILNHMKIRSLVQERALWKAYFILLGLYINVCEITSLNNAGYPVFEKR